MYFKQQLFF